MKTISAISAKNLLENNSGVTLVDVRTQEEYDQAHIEGATCIDFFADDFEQKVSQLDREGSYILYCRTGNRSTQGGEIFEKLGFSEYVQIEAGLLAWSEARFGLVES